MKRLITCFLCLAMLSLVACNKPTDNKKSVVKTSEKVSAEDKKTSESSTLTNESKSGTKICY